MPAEVDDATDVIRVVLADDHDMYRRSMTAVIELDRGIRVVGEARNASEALRACAETRPDLILMDVRMPGGGGIEACRRIVHAVPEALVVMLTMSDDEGDLIDALAAGARGYLFKDMPGERVAAALRRIRDGESVLSPRMAAVLLRQVNDGELPGPQFGDETIDVLRLVARGLPRREIAYVLDIEPERVRARVSEVLDRLSPSAVAEPNAADGNAGRESPVSEDPSAVSPA